MKRVRGYGVRPGPDWLTRAGVKEAWLAAESVVAEGRVGGKGCGRGISFGPPTFSASSEVVWFRYAIVAATSCPCLRASSSWTFVESEPNDVSSWLKCPSCGLVRRGSSRSVTF